MKILTAAMLLLTLLSGCIDGLLMSPSGVLDAMDSGPSHVPDGDRDHHH